MRGMVTTVVVLCVCLSVTKLAATYLVIRRKQSVIGFFMAFSGFLPYGFCYKRFVQSSGIIC